MLSAIKEVYNMSMEFTGISSQLVEYAQRLYANDTDKIITVGEIKTFLQNDAEFISSKISSDSALGELSALFNSQDADDAVKEEAGEDSATANPLEEYTKIQAQITQYQELLARFGVQISAITAESEKLQTQLNDAVATYNNIERNFLTANGKLEDTASDIETAEQIIQDDIEHQQKRAVWQAIQDYNPDEDGDWDSYLEDACKDTVYSSYCPKLNSLIDSSQITVKEVQGLASQLSSLIGQISEFSDKLKFNSTSITQLNSMKEITTTALGKAQKDLEESLLGAISQSEMELLNSIEPKVDLKETLPDGSPRYIFARGTLESDQSLHIYDMSQNGASLARLHGCNNGGLPGADIVPCGNGYMTGFQYLDDCSTEGKEVYYLTNCGMQTKRACYGTCSPLEFDIDGNKKYDLDTSSTIQYDINGDGILDNINNTQDAVLVFNKDGDSISGEDGSECFGENTDLDGDGVADGYANGFEALAALRQKAIDEGVLSKDNDGTLRAEDLAALEEHYGLKIKVGGYDKEAVSLSSVGISEINVSTAAVSDKTSYDAFGNEIQTQAGATFKINGREENYADIWHARFSDEQAADYENIFLGNSDSLGFDVESAARNALNMSMNINSNSANLFASAASNEKDLELTSHQAKSNVNKALAENFWAGTAEPENFFANSAEDEEVEEEPIEEEPIEEEPVEEPAEEDEENIFEKELEKELE